MNKSLIPINRPTGEDEVDKILRRAYDFAKKNDYESALALSDWIIEDESTRIAGLRKRAAIREHQERLDEAVADLERVIEAVDNEPSDYYSLGLLYLQLQKYEKSTELLTKGVEICEVHSYEYYLNPCRINLAYSLIRQSELKEARSVLQNLPNGYSAYFYDMGLKTKEDFLNQVI